MNNILILYYRCKLRYLKYKQQKWRKLFYRRYGIRIMDEDVNL